MLHSILNDGLSETMNKIIAISKHHSVGMMKIDNYMFKKTASLKSRAYAFSLYLFIRISLYKKGICRII